MKKNQFTAIKSAVECADNAKKVNPLDLSADQDLTIALMNMVAIEKQSSSPQLVQMVQEMRTNLMRPLLNNSVYEGDVWDASENMLNSAVLHMDAGLRALESGEKETAYVAFDSAYEAWVVFMGILYGFNINDK